MATTDGLIVFKSSDEVINNSSTFQNDDVLIIPVNVDERFWFSALLFFDSGTIPDIKFSFIGPTGSNIRWERAISGVTTKIGGDSQVASCSGIGTQLMMQLRGSIEVGSTSGNLILQWAQNTAHASDTTLQAGSVIIAHKPGTAATTTGQVVFKTSNQTLANSTTLQDDDELKFEMGANETWMFEVRVIWDAASARDTKFAFDVPLGAVVQWLNVISGPTAPLNEGDTDSEAGAGVGTDIFTSFTGIVINGSNAGTVVLQWAQVSSGADVNTVQENSSLVAHK